MKKLLTRLTAILVVCLMVASLAACGGAGNQSTQETTSQVATTSAAAETTAEPAKEPVTLTWFNQIGFANSGGVQDDPVSKEIQKQTGVTLNAIPQPTKDKLNVLLASSDLPDIIECDTRIYEKQMVDGQQVIDLEPLVQSNGPDILKNVTPMINYIKQFESNGTGKLMHLDGMVDPNGDVNGVFAPWIRWDYYKELGYPEIKSMDDLLNVVDQIVKKHPTTDDGKKQYGFLNWSDWGSWLYLVFGNVLDRNIGGTAFPGFQQNMTTSKDSCAWNDPNGQYWLGAKYMNKARKMGLLDPETLTMKYETALDKAKNNQAVCWFESWLVYPQCNADFKNSGHPEKGYMPLPPVKGVGGYFGQTSPVGMPDRALYISSKCKTPDRAMDLLNYVFSVEGSRTIVNGVKGTNYDNINGVLNYTPDTVTAMQTDKDFVNKTGAGKFAGGLQGLGSGYIAEDGQMIHLGIDPKALAASKIEPWPLYDDYAQHYGVARLPQGADFRQLCEKYAPGDTFMLVYFPVGVPTMSDDMKRTSASIETYILGQLAKAVTAKSDADFDAIQKAAIEEVNKMGAQQIADWLLPLTDKGFEDYKNVVNSK